MLNRQYLAYVGLAAIVVCALALPGKVRNRIQMNLIGAFSRERPYSPRESQLLAENTALKQQLAVVREWLASEDQLDQLREKRVEDLNAQIKYHEQAVCASVIFRDPTAWSSYIWVNRGEGQVVKNSPVLIGDAIVGVVEEVGAVRARVRLITDSHLCPSVQGGNGGAKGQLQGSSAPIWRTQATKLKGIGFISDDARLQKGDLLVTTGLDGVFPAGLKVAKITKVHLPQEGEVTYPIEAKPIAPKIHDLRSVQILPPL